MNTKQKMKREPNNTRSYSTMKTLSSRTVCDSQLSVAAFYSKLDTFQAIWYTQAWVTRYRIAFRIRLVSSKSPSFHCSYMTPACHELTFDCSYTTLSRPALRCLNLLSLTAAKPNWSGTTSDQCSYTRWNAERSESD